MSAWGDEKNEEKTDALRPIDVVDEPR